MISFENLERTHCSESDYCIYMPNAIAFKTFLYSFCMGHFIYESDYRLARDSYDISLLL